MLGASAGKGAPEGSSPLKERAQGEIRTPEEGEGDNTAVSFSDKENNKVLRDNLNKTSKCDSVENVKPVVTPESLIMTMLGENMSNGLKSSGLCGNSNKSQEARKSSSPNIETDDKDKSCVTVG